MSYDYHRPRSLAEALDIAAATPGARFVAGGTDLMVQIHKRAAAPAALISLRHVAELGGIDNGARLRIGSSVTLTELQAEPAVAAGYPALIDSMRPFGSRQIRNMATLGGNLCNASPGADAAPPLLVYDAVVELRDRAGAREMALEEFFVGPGETALAPGEVMTAILLPPRAGDVRSVYLRKARVKMDVATVSVAALVEMEEGSCVRARLAAGAVAPVPKRLRDTEGLLVGSPLDDATIARVSTAAADEISPITDVRSTADYRRHLTGVLLRRALERLRAAPGEGVL